MVKNFIVKYWALASFVAILGAFAVPYVAERQAGILGAADGRILVQTNPVKPVKPVVNQNPQTNSATANLGLNQAALNQLIAQNASNIQDAFDAVSCQQNLVVFPTGDFKINARVNNVTYQFGQHGIICTIDVSPRGCMGGHIAFVHADNLDSLSHSNQKGQAICETAKQALIAGKSVTMNLGLERGQQPVEVTLYHLGSLSINRR